MNASSVMEFIKAAYLAALLIPLCLADEYCEYPLLNDATLIASSELPTREAAEAKLYGNKSCGDLKWHPQ